MEISIGSTETAQRGRTISADRRAMLGELDDQDFEILKVLEGEGASLDAVELAGTARLRPAGVLEALGKLNRLGLVRLAEDDQSSAYGKRFVISHEALSSDSA